MNQVRPIEEKKLNIQDLDFYISETGETPRKKITDANDMTKMWDSETERQVRQWDKWDSETVRQVRQVRQWDKAKNRRTVLRTVF